MGETSSETMGANQGYVLFKSKSWGKCLRALEKTNSANNPTKIQPNVVPLIKTTDLVYSLSDPSKLCS